MLDFAICALTNLFRIYLTDRFVSCFFEKRESSKYKKIVYIVVFWLVNTILFWKLHYVWINIVTNLVGISAIVSLYTESFKNNVFVAFFVYFFMVACDVISTMPFIQYEDGVAHSQVYGVLSFFLIFISELISEKVIKIRRNKNELHSISLIIVPLCSVVVISLLVYSGSCTGLGMALVCLGLLVINFLMLYLYNMLVVSISEKYENDALRQKVDIYANQLRIIQQSEGKIKMLKHDLKHHLNELQLISKQYNANEIQQYIDEMKGYINNPDELVDSGNVEIDSVLNYMLQRAKEKLKDVKVRVTIPENIKHYFEINILIGNLLENAIEASVQTEEKYMGVAIEHKKGVLHIKVENSFLQGKLKRKADYLFATTKEIKEQHGIGLQSVKRIVESSNGSMDVDIENNIFKVAIVLYMPH